MSEAETFSDDDQPRSHVDERRGLRAMKVSEQIAREIVGEISSQRLPTGTKLPSEAAMLEQYDVGRATLREALRILEVPGLITIKPGPGGGPMVNSAGSREFGRMAALFFHATGATFRDLVEARLIVEPLMARLAAEQRQAEIGQRLMATTHLESDDLTTEVRWASAASSFHQLMAEVCGNAIVALLGGALHSVWFERVAGTVFPPDARERLLVDHASIARAIERGDAPLAEELMRVHMQEFLEFCILRYPGLLDEVVSW